MVERITLEDIIKRHRKGVKMEKDMEDRIKLGEAKAERVVYLCQNGDPFEIEIVHDLYFSGVKVIRRKEDCISLGSFTVKDGWVTAAYINEHGWCLGLAIGVFGPNDGVSELKPYF